MLKDDQSSVGRLVAQWMHTARLIQKRVFCSGAIGTVNPQQMHALVMIQEHDGLTMKELADYLDITSPSATSLVNRLVKLKWVTRVSDPSNRKLVRVRIAPEGAAFLHAKMSEISAAMTNILSLLNMKDQQDFSRILSNLHIALTQSDER